MNAVESFILIIIFNISNTNGNFILLYIFYYLASLNIKSPIKTKKENKN